MQIRFSGITEIKFYKPNSKPLEGFNPNNLAQELQKAWRKDNRGCLDFQDGAKMRFFDFDDVGYPHRSELESLHRLIADYCKDPKKKRAFTMVDLEIKLNKLRRNSIDSFDQLPQDQRTVKKIIIHKPDVHGRPVFEDLPLGRYPLGREVRLV